MLSIRAQYGGPDTGVRARIARYREAVSAPCDDLTRLASLGGSGLHDILEIDQRTSRRLKTGVIVDAAERLTAAGFRSSHDVADDPQSQAAAKVAYTAVPGLGPVTFEYFLMLLGKPGIKADTHIRRYVASA